ncbi:exopolyphosphatase [Shewanella ulleungensis]|uniref:Ppx/GppA phosphatase family protein n=1 Tax=Shewanella ulleungensis TaxID=2282699 RepID=UPI003D7937BB
MSSSEQSLHFVAIDMGSNSFHLVIAREQHGSIQILHKEKRQVQLAKGLRANGSLDDDAIERGLACLTEFNQRFSDLEQTRVRLVATHTLRVATNCHQFIKAALDIIPYPIEIVSGHEEARLIYNGIMHSQTLTEQNLVIDIGGGSTEVIVGKATSTSHLASLKCGCVSYQQRFFYDGALTKDNFKAAQSAADKQFSQLSNAYFKSSWQLVLGSSGTVKAIAEALQCLTGSQQGLNLNNLKTLKHYLMGVGHIDNIKLDNLDPKRISLLAPGLSILISFFKRLSINEMQVAQGALREGVLYELSQIEQFKGVKQRTVSSLAQLYHIDPIQAANVTASIDHLFSQVATKWHISEYQWLLNDAAMLHEIGIQINSRAHQKHGGYIIQNSDLPGFNQLQQQLLALLVANQRKRINIAAISELNDDEQTLLIRLLVIFRLAMVMNLGRISNSIEPINLTVDEQTVTLSLAGDQRLQNDLLCRDLAQEQKKLAMLGISLRF